MSEYVEDDRIPIQEIIDKITPQDIVKAESKKTVDFNPTPVPTPSALRTQPREKYSDDPKPPDIASKIFKKRLTF